MMNPLGLNSTLTASKNQVSASLSPDGSGTMVILGLTEGAYFELNDVGSRIWQLLQQPCSVRSIRDTLLEDYEVGTEQCEQDVLRLINELIERGLAVVVNGADS